MPSRSDLDIAVWANAGSGGAAVWIPGDSSKVQRIPAGKPVPLASPFDVILVSAEAFVDHPSFGTSVIARVLRSMGFSIAVIAQPDPSRPADFEVFGRPSLFFGVTAGNLDSLVRFYTPALKERGEDAYSENGVCPAPCYLPTVVYTNLIRRVHGRVPVVLGGVEASMRKVAHFDYRRNGLAESVLASSGADLLVYGNGETQVAAIALAMAKGPDRTRIPTDIPGTAWLVREGNRDSLPPSHVTRLPGYPEIAACKELLGKATIDLERALSERATMGVLQGQAKNDVFVNPPPPQPKSGDLDEIYALPFTRQPAPVYDGRIKAFEMIRFSITAHRGCYGSCTFCCLAAHQGRSIVSRTRESILAEVRLLASEPGFKGYITDLGGPSANMYASGCPRLRSGNPCQDKRCIGNAGICPNLASGMDEYASVLAEAARIPGVKKVFVASGIRFDLLNRFDPQGRFLSQLVLRHTSGHFKIAPEHVKDSVLSLMNKPSLRELEAFLERFERVRGETGANVFLLPYFISSFPGCSSKDMASAADYIRKRFGRIEQVQDFVPTPGTIAAAMYFSGRDPVSGKEVTVERTRTGRQAQRGMLNFEDKPKSRASKTAPGKQKPPFDADRAKTRTGCRRHAKPPGRKTS